MSPATAAAQIISDPSIDKRLFFFRWAKTFFFPMQGDVDRDRIEGYSRGLVKKGDYLCYFLHKQAISVNYLPEFKGKEIYVFSFPKGFNRVSEHGEHPVWGTDATNQYMGPCCDIDLSKPGWWENVKYQKPIRAADAFLTVTDALKMAGMGKKANYIIRNSAIMQNGRTYIAGHTGTLQLIPLTAVIEARGTSSKKPKIEALWECIITSTAKESETSCVHLPPCDKPGEAIKVSEIAKQAVPSLPEIPVRKSPPTAAAVELVISSSSSDEVAPYEDSDQSGNTLSRRPPPPPPLTVVVATASPPPSPPRQEVDLSAASKVIEEVFKAKIEKAKAELGQKIAFQIQKRADERECITAAYNEDVRALDDEHYAKLGARRRKKVLDLVACEKRYQDTIEAICDPSAIFQESPPKRSRVDQEK